MVEWTDMLRCPNTGNGLQFDETASVVRVVGSERTYPVIDGIVDFCPESNNRVATAYDRAAPRYDSHMTSATIPIKVIGRIVWGFASDRDPVGKALALLPDQFYGILLDVPVGTGIFTASIYSRYPSATIIGVDCSMNMLQKAKARFQEQGVSNVHLLKADAGNLPIREAAVDMVLSMNGWHAFADKQGTAAEMRRVLRHHGALVACGYIQGARWLSDWFVRCFGAHNGFFTPPFFTFDDLAEQFKGFTVGRKGNDKSIAWLEARKEGA